MINSVIKCPSCGKQLSSFFDYKWFWCKDPNCVSYKESVLKQLNIKYTKENIEDSFNNASFPEIFLYEYLFLFCPVELRDSAFVAYFLCKQADLKGFASTLENILQDDYVLSIFPGLITFDIWFKNIYFVLEYYYSNFNIKSFNGTFYAVDNFSKKLLPSANVLGEMIEKGVLSSNAIKGLLVDKDIGFSSVCQLGSIQKLLEYTGCQSNFEVIYY